MSSLQKKSKFEKSSLAAKSTPQLDVFSSSSFSSLGLEPALCDQLKERLGFESPTQVQAQAIPIILSGRHVLVNAATGTGKTIAYLAPIIHHLQKYEPRIKRTDGTFALVLVFEILQKLLHRFHWIVPGIVMGGENKAKEKARLRKGISILVATPGRLLDHLKNTQSFSYVNMRWLIFDEADRILELGFGKEIEDIINVLGSRKNRSDDNGAILSTSGTQRQNLLLSATLNEKVNNLAKISLENPLTVGLDEKKEHHDFNPAHVRLDSDTGEAEDSGPALRSSDGDYNLPPQLVQRYAKVPCGSRIAVLLSVLKNLFERDAGQKVVVFFSTCDAVDFHYTLISQFLWPPNSAADSRKLFLGCKTFRLHGSMKQDDRRSTFQTFKTENSAILLSTDVAARGLDFPKVRCIIQYDSPGEATEYVHRVGRTARLGKKGESLLFLQPIETDYLKDLEKHGVILSEFPLTKVLDSFPVHDAKYRGAKKFATIDMHPWILTLQKELEQFISAEAKLKKLAQDAFLSWVRAYTAHRGDLKRIFMVRKLHLGHVAKSFALKEQPSMVGGSFFKQTQKRKKEQKQRPTFKKRKITSKT
ncbi:hypothetical protein V2J09_014802 [Rumex salicifolius]